MLYHLYRLHSGTKVTICILTLGFGFVGVFFPLIWVGISVLSKMATFSV